MYASEVGSLGVRRLTIDEIEAGCRGPARVLAAVNAARVDAQVAVLTDAQTQATAYRATLPA